MAKIQVTWDQLGAQPEYCNVYRAFAPMDVNALPPPIAVVPGGTTVFEDTDPLINVSTPTYYIIGAVLMGDEKLSSQVQAYRTVDPYFSSVVALLHFDGGPNDVTGRVWTTRGTQAVLQASSALFGASGLRVDGIDSSWDTAAQLGIASGEAVTIEGWMRIASYTGPKMPSANEYNQVMFGQSGNTGARDQYLVLKAGHMYLYRDSAYTGGSIINATGTGLAPLNEFFHFALSHDGVTTRCFMDGVKQIEAACPVGWGNTSLPFRIGANLNTAYQQYRQGCNADFDDFRITKGVARYTSNFTPARRPFPNNA